jgi:hypothetical protein
VPPFWFVAVFNVIKHVGIRFIACPVCFVRRALGFDRGEEALHGRVIPAIARVAHRTGDAKIVHQARELFAGVLAAAVGVVP